MSLEGLSLYHNCLRSLPPAIANLQALTYLNVRYPGKGGSWWAERRAGRALGHSGLHSQPSSLPLLSRNQISVLPACLCHLPLKVLIASNNKLAALPEDIGSLSSLRQLVSLPAAELGEWEEGRGKPRPGSRLEARDREAARILLAATQQGALLGLSGGGGGGRPG